MKLLRLKRAFLPVLGWIALFTLVEVTARLVVKDDLLLPSAAVIIEEAGSLLLEPDFYLHLRSTLNETLASTGIALLLGVPLGLLLGRSVIGRALFESVIDWLRSIPATALFPAMLLFFGLGRGTRIAIAIYAAVFSVLIPSMFGAASADEDRLRHLKRSGLNGAERVLHSVGWEAMKSMLSGLRLAISAALVLVVVGEMFIGSNAGLGFLIMRFQERYQTAEMYGAIVLVGLLGYLINRLVRFVERLVPA